MTRRKSISTGLHEANTAACESGNHLKAIIPEWKTFKAVFPGVDVPATANPPRATSVILQVSVNTLKLSYVSVWGKQDLKRTPSLHRELLGGLS